MNKNGAELKNWKSRARTMINDGQLKVAENLLRKVEEAPEIICEGDDLESLLRLREKLFLAYFEKGNYVAAVRVIKETNDENDICENSKRRAYQSLMLSSLIASKAGMKAWRESKDI